MSGAYYSEPAEENPNRKDSFVGGMMPVPTTTLSYIIIDVRSLNLSDADGKALEASIRTHALAEINKIQNISNRNLVDISTSVLGIAID
jgi:hypothetical protein